jgi:hypothetical protein
MQRMVQRRFRERQRFIAGEELASLTGIVREFERTIVPAVRTHPLVQIGHRDEALHGQLIRFRTHPIGQANGGMQHQTQGRLCIAIRILDPQMQLGAA